MAEITNPLLQLIGGKPTTVAAGDTIPQSKITNLVSDLSSLNSSVSAAQADATLALSNAAAAQSTADSAFTAAQGAQADATQALADAAAAQGTADSAVTAAAAAQSDATQALADAAAAQSTADGAASAAAAAQSTADGAASAAAAAQSDATLALSNAAAAQSDATQALSDAAAAMAEATAAHSDATQALADAAAAQATADAALPATGPATLSGDLTVTGDLTVQGEFYSKQVVNLLVSDSFADLNSGNVVTGSATAGGLTVNVQASGTAYTASAFVAGVLSTSAPYLTTSASTLLEGDIVQVSGSTDAKNDGLYVVASGSGATTVYIKGIGGTSVDQSKTPFAKNQFIAQTSQAATVTKVNLSVLAASNGLIQDDAGSIPAGTFCYAYAAPATESAFSTWTAITSATIPTLQQVLAAGSSLGSSNKLNYSLETQANTDQGCVVYVDSAGVCQKLSSAVADGEIAGVTLSQSDTGANSFVGVASVVGQIVMVKAKSGDEPAKGNTVYVSSVAGSIGVTAPTSGRIIKFGKCVGDVSGGLYPCLLQPQLIADISA